MARDVLWRLLGDDPVLMSRFGVDRSRVLPNYSFDEPPLSGFFLTLRFEDTARRRGGGMVWIVTVAAHRKRSETSDFTELSALLARVVRILVHAEPQVGDDGARFTAARHIGTSRDTYDMGFSTITRAATFEIAAGLRTDPSPPREVRLGA